MAICKASFFEIIKMRDEYLIQPSVQKRPRPADDDPGTTAQSELGLIDGQLKTAEALDTKTTLDDTNKKRHACGRGRPTTGRGRASKSNEHSHIIVPTSSSPPSNGVMENSFHKEEITFLRGKVAFVEEELSRARKEAAEYQKTCQQLETELKDCKEREQQMKPKREKMLSDLLISVSKAERQEARLKVRQDSLRLGNVGIIRAGTIVSETWEDGQALKDINAQLAYDLLEHRYVACKLHGLNMQWSEEKKQSYIRHAIREYNIHKSLVHSNIVRLWDTFEIDHNIFCTILEYCSGKDLDAVLKATPVLPEREARVIIVQIFQGFVYLNKRSQKIIHYDLKPGNVLFDEMGVAKVTDFGLSKIVEDDVGSQGMELTSQGAGTYWYLPPECFELSKTPLISSKVDVWSVGILLYQMLFGRRPFGHDQTQERILREDTIIKARRVDFPSRPSVSNEAKDLIRRCLTYDQAERPDVLSVAQDPYLSYTKK